MPISGGRRYLFISSLDHKTELIWKRFCKINNLSLADVATVCSHFLVARDLESLSSPAGFEALDQAFREYLEKQPEEWRKVPLLTRLLGHVLKPLYRADIESIEVTVAEGEA